MLKPISEFINMPTKEESEEIAEKFEQMSHIPQILMVIDGTHIPVLAPTVRLRRFYKSEGMDFI